MTGPSLMTAIRYDRFGGPDVMKLVELPAPEPGPGQVRVALHAASVIPADWKLRAGELQHLFAIDFPKIPGRDGAGVVTKVGAGVDYVALGAKVCVVAQHSEPGTYAQAIVRERDSIVELPDNLSFDQGAALMHAGICAWIALIETAKLERGMRILVHAGAGAIGGLAVQLADHIGAHVAATCRSANIDYVAALGADEVVAYDREDFSEKLGGFDIVLDLIGGDVHRRSYAVLRRGGHMICLHAAPIRDQSQDFGVRLSFAPIHDRHDALAAVADLARRGVLRPQIRDRVPLAQAADAQRRLECNEVTRGRLVLQIEPYETVA
jgi:NADPH:quinone reductase-like Zn-dependent oxidoreductase